MITLYDIRDAATKLAEDVSKYLLTKDLSWSISENPIVSLDDNNIDIRDDTIWLWIDVNNHAHYKFGYTRDARTNWSWRLRVIQKLNSNNTWQDFKHIVD